MVNPMKRNAGTSLVELLVVIVIFLIGILGVIQVFPGGLQALSMTRNNSIANELARTEIERVKGRSDRLAEMILPVTYVWSVTGISILADTSRDNRNLGPAGVGIDTDGMVLDGANNVLGKVQLLSGANIVRRVVGEGGRVPAPRNVNGVMGGLMVLQFAPILFNPAYSALLSVYGNDMVRRFDQPGPGSINRNYEFYVSEEDDAGSANDTIYLPIIQLPVDPAASPYRVSFSYYVNDGSANRLDEVIDLNPQEIRNNLVISLAHPGYWTLNVQQVLTAANVLTGLTYISIDDESTKVQKNFERVVAFAPNNPYQYQLLDPNLGVMLFDPSGYSATERTRGGTRIPLRARVNYEVLDWRIIRQEFRTPVSAPYNVKLSLSSLMVTGQGGPDRKPYQGMEFPVSDGAGGQQRLDLVVMDVDSGAVLLHDPTNPRDPSIPVTTSNDYMAVDPTRSSYAVDKSTGMIRLLDFDRNSANGLQVQVIYPGTGVTQVAIAGGRRFMAFYQARNEWAVQVMKAPSVFQIVWDRPGVAQCYVGGSSLFGGTGTRIYFPGMDAGKKVTIGEIWYFDSGGNRLVMRDQDFLITGTGTDLPGLPYVDIRTVDVNATAFDFGNGYAVRTVKGASISARVLWNPASLNWSTDTVENIRIFERWAQQWRRTTVENYLERGEN